MVMLLVHHNSFFNLSDHLTRYISNELKGSPAAVNFACGRTKTAAIINYVGSHMKNALVEDIKNNPFSIMRDGSNDSVLYKIFPVTVRIFDIYSCRIMPKFLDMNVAWPRCIDCSI